MSEMAGRTTPSLYTCKGAIVFPASAGQPLFGPGDMQVQYDGPMDMNIDPEKLLECRHVVIDDAFPSELLQRMNDEAFGLPMSAWENIFNQEYPSGDRNDCTGDRQACYTWYMSGVPSKNQRDLPVLREWAEGVWSKVNVWVPEKYKIRNSICYL